ncbi:hypothetical protein AGMMS49944_24840 [Spirochaetia bacterium]|nr:hypothetical protein AGMMS49944_24840 [Spirochaetia bacterium]
MGVYCQMLEDAAIMKNLTGLKKVLIITCPGCACESLSYDKQLPNRSLAEGKGFENIAIAVHRERDRIAQICAAAGIETDTITVAFPCELVETECERIVLAAENTDAVCVLACSGGFLGIRDIMPDYPGKIIPLMKSAGTFVFHLAIDPAGSYSLVKRQGARILHFAPAAAED